MATYLVPYCLTLGFSFSYLKISVYWGDKTVKPIASVIITVKNASSTIVDCLHSILNQTFSNFEIIIIDDFSTDDTMKLIKSLCNKHIKYFRNEKWLGITASRNRGIRKATGDYLFFTDGDCTVSKNWIEIGLKSLSMPNCVGVEGRIYYVSEDYKSTFSDHVMENRSGGNFMTGNVAYRKAVIEKVGGFDENLTYLEDRDLAFRVMKYGKICFNPGLIVYHPRVINTPERLIKSSINIKNRVHTYRKFQMKDSILWRIVLPRNLIRILFPPLVFFSLFSRRFKYSEDFRLLPFVYVYLVLQRLHLWKECAREKVYLI